MFVPHCANCEASFCFRNILPVRTYTLKWICFRRDHNALVSQHTESYRKHEGEKRKQHKKEALRNESGRQGEGRPRNGDDDRARGEEARIEFQVALVPSLSHLDLYCCCRGISAGLPDSAQGYWNSLRDKRKTNKKMDMNGKRRLLLLKMNCSPWADGNTVASTVKRLCTRPVVF